MRQRSIPLLCFLLMGLLTQAQQYQLSGYVRNLRLEPLPLASVQLKGSSTGAIADENGFYKLELSEGSYELVISMTGYQSRVIPIVVSNNTTQDVILEPDTKDLAEIRVKGKLRDRSEEYIRQVIRHKEKILAASSRYSCEVYIRASQSAPPPLPRKKKKDTVSATDTSLLALQQMAMAEITIRYQQADEKRYKEDRTGVSKRGNPESLFHLSTTEANLSLYQNLLRARTLSVTPFISPISWSGLEAYRFKLLRTDWEQGRKVYTIGIRPRKLSNAVIAGVVLIADSSWTILESRFRLPSYHLPEYDELEVIQKYSEPQPGISVLRSQQFLYHAKQKRGVLSGTTMVEYRNYDFDPEFPANYFGVEKGATSAEAYERDSSYWNQVRAVPLSKRELQYMRFADSVRRVQTSQPYLDSIDRETNSTSFKKIAWAGQTLYNRDKGRTWRLPAAVQLVELFQFGGARLSLPLWYDKQYANRKNLNIFGNLSYGFRNRDVNGIIRVRRMYNPFNRGFFQVDIGRAFDYVFPGDAWINMISRSNLFLNNAISLQHGHEISNGLFLTGKTEFALRRSVADYKTNDRVDSLLADIIENNQAVEFEPYNAFYASLRLAYTPAQPYIREPLEKIILPAKWPTFYVELRKGIPGIGRSVVDFDYVEAGMQQELRLGILGNSRYTVKTGGFLSKKDLRLVDYKFQRRGDPIFFMNPDEAFQSLDSSFPVFKRFYEGHYVHEFNGALINKIPLLRKLQLREVAGAGFLIAPERKLRYGEIFAGIERVIKAPFNPQIRFKLGFYISASAANQFSNPVQFKIGLTTWDKIRNRWF